MGLPKDIIERFMKVDPSTMGHHVGVRFMRPEMKPVNRQSKTIGPAYTVRLEGRDSFALYSALEKAPKGSVIVVDRCGDGTFACVGEMVALFAECQGFAGLVVDGPITDSLALERSGFPVFATGVSVVTTMVLGISGEEEVAVSCAGATVHPGDLVFGDADGMVVLPPDDYLGPLAKAEEAVAREIELRKHFRAGGHPRINVERLRGADVLGMISELKKYG